ncbi:hypothetical protein JOM56_002926 [Amanita muscaria]
MDAPDPLLEEEPDFLAEQYLQARNDIIALGVPEDAIAGILRQIWVANRQVRHEAWVADRERQHQGDPPRNNRPQEDGAQPPDAPNLDEGDGTQPKGQKAKTFPQGVAVPDAESPHPSEYARQKIAKFEYIELWYFSREGLAEAAQPTTSTSNDTFGIITGDLGAVQLCPVATTKASKNALPDEALSWDQISFGSKVYVEALRKEKWPDQHIRALINFFSQLDFQRTRLTSIPDRVFIEYQATVRREWMSTWDFDISQFNIARLQAIQSRVTMHAHQTAIVSNQLAYVSTR